MKYSYNEMNQVLKNNDFSFKKKFGQNFIVDYNVINSIISKSLIDKDTLVIEVGPGAGSLTYMLCKYAKNVLCYEIDDTLKDILSNNLSEYDNYEVIFCDFLKRNVSDDLKKYSYKKVYLVANLPYYITTPIIMKIIDDKIDIDKIVIMVQKEVGDRFKAKPNSRDYNSLSVFLNFYYDVKKLLDVSRHVFMPVPNVDSIVVELDRKKNLTELKNEELFFNLVKDSFKQKRKNLRNNLKGYDLNKVESVLKKHNMDLSFRAEQLDVDIFIEISNEL